MENPQNGVNGSIPPPSCGYNSFINPQMPRGNSQTMFSYESVPQVLTNTYVGPGFISHNYPNQMRSISPMSYVQYVVPPMNAQYNQPHQQIYSHPQFNNQYDVQLTHSTSFKNVSNVSTRKHNPLTVIDPNSKTNVDLARFKNSSNTQNFAQISEPKIEKTLSDKNDELKTVNENIKNQEEESITEKDNDEKSDEGKSTTKIDDSAVEIDSIEQKFDSEDLTKTDIKMLMEKSEISAYIDVQKDYDVLETVVIEKNIVEETSDDHIKLQEHLMGIKCDKDEEIIACSSEEEIVHVESNIPLPNYHLPIDTKESDETTLKRKLIYDREYLIKLKDIGKSLQKPLNMPSEFVDNIISKTPRLLICNFPESSSFPSSIQDKNKKQFILKQYSPGFKNYKRPHERKQINLEIYEPVFIRSVSGYQPPHIRDKQKSEIDPLSELKRNIKSNLNKITPQNFQDCFVEIQKLNIESKDEMSCLINEIFIKAVKEEAYSVTYAQFCNKLSQHYVENQSFKGQLLKKCQDMFETPLQEQLNTVKNDWELKISQETDLKMKVLYESDLEEQVKKAKDKYFGNIRFIGELFLHNLLAAKVILNCINELLNASDESDAMLALCKLLETCGKQIDVKHKEQMNNFILRINELAKLSNLEKRIRFKLKDITDMRIRGWTLRHVQQEKKINPKTLQEQKEEAAAEASAAALRLVSMNRARNVPINNSTNNSRRNISNPNIKIKHLKFNPQNSDENVILGPSGGSWISGSGSKTRINEMDGCSNKSKIASVRHASNSHSREQSPQVTKANRYRPLESSAEASGADSRSSTPPLPLPFSKPYRMRNIESKLAMSDEERSEMIFNELLSTNNFNINSWMQIRCVKPIIEKWIDDMMEKDVNCRRAVGDSFNTLLLSKKLTAEQIVEGTRSFVSSIDDLICDIPKIWEFFAQFLERFICDKTSNISFFENIFKSMLPCKDVGHCFSVVCHEASSRLGHVIVGQVFNRSINWKAIIAADEIDSFIEVNELKFTRDGGTLTSSFCCESLSSIGIELDEMLSKNSSNENIFDFLEKRVDRHTWKKSEYTRIITGSILNAAIKKMPNISVREYLRDKKEIIKRISNHKVDNEIEILKSVLDKAPELQKDTLMQIYDVMMTERLVSSNALQLYLNDSSLQSESNFKLTFPIISQLNVEER